MLDPKLLNVLACPECKIDLVYRRIGSKEDLVCPKCGQVFQIDDGVPDLSPKMVK